MIFHVPSKYKKTMSQTMQNIFKFSFPTTSHFFKYENTLVVKYSNNFYWLVLDALKIVDIINMQNILL